MPDGGSEGGREQVTDGEIVTAIQAALSQNDAPAASTSDIADRLPIGRQGVKRRLDGLAEEGTIGMHKAGRNRFWWVSDDAHDSTRDLNTVIEPGDLSDQKLIELSQSQLSASDLPNEWVDDILDARLSANQIPRDMVFKKLSEDISSSEVPEDISSEIVQEAFGYDPTYWASKRRQGVGWIAVSGISIMFAVLLISFTPPTSSFLPQQIVQSIVEIIGVGIIVFWFSSFVLGIFYWGVGVAGSRFSNTDDPRPWKQHLPDVVSLKLGRR